MEGNYNLRNPAVKRLMREAQELKDPSEQFSAHPLDDNLFEWHFTIRGPADSDFADGFYHGRIILPPEYPMKPPSIILLTPSGRFETNKKICLSISGYHPETWLPSWSLRTALLGIIGFLPSHGGGAIGSLEYSTEERKDLAKKSQEWRCPHCGLIKELVLPTTQLSQHLNQEARQIAQQIKLTGEKPKGEEGEQSFGSSEEGENNNVTETASETPAVTATTSTTITTTISTALATTPSTTISYPATMTYQLPPYNLAQAYPMAFPPFPVMPTTSQQQQQARPYNPNVFPPQFMWPYQPNFLSSSTNQPFPFFNAPFPTFPRMNSPFSNQPFYPFPSVPSTSPLTVITSLSSTTLSYVTSTTPSIPATLAIPHPSTSTPQPTSTQEKPKASTKSSTLLSKASTSTSTIQSPPSLSSTSSSSSSSSEVHTSPSSSSGLASSSGLTSSSSSGLTSSSVQKSSDAPSLVQPSSSMALSSSPSSPSSPSSSASELRHRFKPTLSATTSLTTTTSSSSSSSSSPSTSLTSSTTTTPITSNSQPRIIRTHTSAEPSHRPNYHTGSGFLDAIIDLCVIFILFCIFALLSRRVFLNF